MARTRSQDLHAQIKKEECEGKLKKNKLLHRTKNTTRNKNKIIKKEKTAKTEPVQAQIVTVKLENNDGSKEILELRKRTSKERSPISKEQIAEVIGYIVNDKMSTSAASRKAKMSQSTTHRYYQQYQNDLEHKIPLPRTLSNKQSIKATQRKIEDLIHYIIHDKMNVAQAAVKARMTKQTADRYYKEYAEDPNSKIPVLASESNRSYNQYTQKKIKELIGYIVDDGVTIAAASKKANMTLYSAKIYYLKYLWDPNHEIPVPRKFSINNGKRCTNNQIKKLIGFIVDNGISILKASVMTDMSITTANKYYKQYLEDPNHDIPTTNTNHHSKNQQTISLDQLKVFFHCITIDKSSVKEASRKAEISNSSGKRYYTRYFENPSDIEKNTDTSYSEEKMKKMLEYIQNKGMGMKSAAMKVSLCYGTALKYYRRYLKNPQLGIPITLQKKYTQEDIKRLIDSIEHENMNIASAAKRNKMNYVTAYKYYKLYQNDPKHKIPVPNFKGHTQKHKTIEKYSQIIADTYKNNPPIKPMHASYKPSDSSLPDIDIKQELLDEDMKMMLKDEE